VDAPTNPVVAAAGALQVPDLIAANEPAKATIPIAAALNAPERLEAPMKETVPRPAEERAPAPVTVELNEPTSAVLPAPTAAHVPARLDAPTRAVAAMPSEAHVPLATLPEEPANVAVAVPVTPQTPVRFEAPLKVAVAMPADASAPLVAAAAVVSATSSESVLREDQSVKRRLKPDIWVADPGLPRDPRKACVRELDKVTEVSLSRNTPSDAQPTLFASIAVAVFHVAPTVVGYDVNAV
jgi:hypothetical protein